MREELNWEEQIAKFKRGGGVFITGNPSFAEIDPALVKYWNTIFEIAMKYGKVDYNIKVGVGIWLDTGEITSMIYDVREFCRISLSVMEIEEAYFDLPKGDEVTFTKEYGLIFDRVKFKLLHTFDPKKFEELGKAKKGCNVIICNCDDVETEEEIFKT